MRATAWVRLNPLEAGWAVFAAANWAAMVVWPSWETVPFHFVWISLTFVYGVRVWSSRTMWAVLSVVMLATGASILSDTFNGIQLWGELFEVPLMSAMFLGMAARRPGGTEERPRRADRERGQVHGSRRCRRACGAGGRHGRRRDRGLGLGEWRSARGAAAHLRPLGAGGRRTHPRARRRRAGARARGRGRTGARRPLFGEAPFARDGLPAPPSRAGRALECATPDAGR